MGPAAAADPPVLTGRAGLAVGAWAVLALVGWATGSVAVTALAPLALIGVPVAVLLQQRSAGRVDPLEPIWALVAIFGFTYLLVPGLSAARPEDFASLPGYLDAPPAQWQAATWLAAGGFLALLAGYWGPLGPKVATRLPPPRAEGDPRALGRLALVLFGLGCASGLATIVIAGGERLPAADLLTGDLRRETVRSFTGRGYLTVGFAMLALSIPLLVAWAAARRDRVAWATVAGATITAEVLLGGVVGSRILALGIPIAIAVVVHYRVRAIPLGVAAAGGVAAALLGVAIAAARGTASVTDPLSAVGGLGLTLDGFNFLVNAIARTPDLLWGSSLSEDTLLTYLPRGLWAGKPEIYGVVGAQEAIVPGLYDDFQRGATFPPGIMAEGFVNFGVVGAVAFPLAAGVALRTAYLRLLEVRTTFYVVLIAWLLANLLSVMRALGPMIPNTLLILALLSPLVLSGRRTRAPDGSPGRRGRATGR